MSHKLESLRIHILRVIFRTQKDTDKDSKAYWNLNSDAVLNATVKRMMSDE